FLLQDLGGGGDQRVLGALLVGAGNVGGCHGGFPGARVIRRTVLKFQFFPSAERRRGRNSAVPPLRGRYRRGLKAVRIGPFDDKERTPCASPRRTPPRSGRSRPSARPSSRRRASAP